ncbi:hypothetical protein LPJ73_006212 [Coemansia sp. RSA 2703]|nr:hypothetical protein LPJ73_006212 [Coemansia sp. RSA 2703]KAJ2371412.1 hypothetical protein IW150_004608 [Coemansia sp. RSA 2607]KAJ2394540.1 hypothetical protein GGI05_001993 [Coemansia sp. RSA 2603]
MRIRAIPATVAIAFVAIVGVVVAGNTVNDTSAAEISDTSDAYGRCPEASRCYFDNVRAACVDGGVCPKQLVKVVACAWTCAPDARLPPGCRQRCKPCKGKPRCARVCQCEIECSAAGPCAVAQ